MRETYLEAAVTSLEATRDRLEVQLTEAEGENCRLLDDRDRLGQLLQQQEADLSATVALADDSEDLARANGELQVGF